MPDFSKMIACAKLSAKKFATIAVLFSMGLAEKVCNVSVPVQNVFSG